MNIFKTDSVRIESAERFLEGKWEKEKLINQGETMVLTDCNEIEHDKILNLGSGLDEDGLKGYMVNLITGLGREVVNLAAIPVSGQIIKHDSNHYLVYQVVQSTKFDIAVYVKQLSKTKYNMRIFPRISFV